MDEKKVVVAALRIPYTLALVLYILILMLFFGDLEGRGL
jgi:hypothetical protein